MTRLPTLLRKFEAVTLDIAQLTATRAALHAEIVAFGRDAAPPRRKRTGAAEIAVVVRDTVKVLRDASTPLPRKEIAARLGITPWAASYRLKQATKAGFVENVGGGRYQVTNVVPAF